MKKSYSKPDIAFESFSLSTNIANGACSYVVHSHAEGDCGVIFGERMVFLEKINGCERTGAYAVEDGSPLANYLCYHVPTEANSMFMS